MNEVYYQRVDALLEEEIKSLREKLRKLERERELLYTKRNSEALIESTKALWEALSGLVQICGSTIIRWWRKRGECG